VENSLTDDSINNPSCHPGLEVIEFFTFCGCPIIIRFFYGKEKLGEKLISIGLDFLLTFY